jgi:CelD/BcsL family acetyltransferase involved in cellulose biosynthesis
MSDSTIELHATSSLLRAGAVSTDQEFRDLEPEWKRLFRQICCSNVFLSFEWLSEWWRHFGREGKLLILTLRDECNSLVALAPLYIAREGRLRLRKLGFLGDQWVGSDHLDFLVDRTVGPIDMGLISDIVLEQRAEWDYVQLSDVREDSIAATVFRRSMEKMGLTSTLTPSTVCPYGDLPRTEEELMARISSRFRRSLRYDAGNLRRQGLVEFATFTDWPEALPAFDELLRLHKSRFKHRHAASAFVGSAVEAFHQDVFRTLVDAGWAQIRVLKVDGACVAAAYQLACNRSLYSYQNGIDPAYSRFSVGHQLLQFTLQDAIRRGYTEFDFLRGDEPYKSKWVGHSRTLFHLRLFDQRLASRIARATITLRRALRQSKSALQKSFPTRLLTRHP